MTEGALMTRPAFLRQSEMKRMAEIAVEYGVCVEAEASGMILRVRPLEPPNPTKGAATYHVERFGGEPDPVPPPQDLVGDDDPITLEEACRVFFHGRLTKSALRAEQKRGNLEIIRIANKDFVTHNGLKRMYAKCRESGSHDVSTSTIPAPPHIARPISAQEALRLKLSMPAKSSKNVLPRN